MKKSPLKVFTEDLEENEVLRAWWSLEALPTALEKLLPSRVELLRKKHKSIVYRLPRLGVDGTDVIAKHCLRESALAERKVYEVLEGLAVETTRYYGYVGNGTDEFCWLFLEDAGGEPFDPERREHVELAAQWLARLHTETSRMEQASQLPERGPAHYRRHLMAAQRLLDRLLETLDLPPGGKSLLRQVQAVFDDVAARWIEVEALARAMPWALVHGDFAERNVRVRHDGKGGSQLFVFDWEVAGWGFPGTDLGFVDADLYHACVQAGWPQVDRDSLERFAHLGALLRAGIAAMHWEALKLEVGWPPRCLANMKAYLSRIQDAFQGLGWDHPSSDDSLVANGDGPACGHNPASLVCSA